MKTVEERIKERIQKIALDKSVTPSDWRWIEGYMIEGYKIAMEEYRTQCDDLPGKDELTRKLIEVSSIEQTRGGVKTTTYFADIVDLFYSIASPIIASRDARIRELEEALRGIAEGKGRYDTDKLIHASNTIQDMIQLANNALTPTNL